MKKKIVYLLSLAVFAVFFQSCSTEGSHCQEEFISWRQVPEYHSWEEIRQEITNNGPEQMKKPGKIYFYNDYILINEQRKGIHIVDNSIPASPKFINFISIPGNMDMSVRNNTLYADNYTDLLTIDITNVYQATLIKRLENAFPPDDINPTLGVLTHYNEERVVMMVNCDGGGRFLDVNESSVAQTFSGDQASGGDGIGGSFARFTLSGDYLYTVSESDIHVFNLEDINCPVKTNTVGIGFGIETIFPYDGRLFIGSTTGMSIYGLQDPTRPEYISSYDHWTGCDPVFVSGNYAYVTIHSGRTCGEDLDQLDVLNISDIYNPVLERSFAMEHPHGLSVSNETLYLCEGEFGLKVFDVSQPLLLDQSLRNHFKHFAAYDVIALPGFDARLLLIGADGFYQFDISDPHHPVEISRISVTK